VLDLSQGSESYEFEDEESKFSPRTTSRRRADGRAPRGADHRSAAERAACRRTWAFGHIIVDEAQELSAMAWRC